MDRIADACPPGTTGTELEPIRVAVFTDNDFNKINGVTTTLNAVLRHAPARARVRIYTAADLASECPDYFAVPSVGVGLPWYREMRVYWPRLRRFEEALRRDRIDVVHITTPGPVGLAGRVLAHRLGLPVVGSYHTLLGHYVEAFSGSERLGRAMERYMRWLYGACETILVPSLAVREYLDRAGYPADRLRLWARGVDVDLFNPERRSVRLRNRWHVDDRRPVVMYAGRLSREKGLDLLPAIQRLLYADRVAHRLVIVGDGPMMPDLQRGCPDAHFTGRIGHDAVAAAMASADVFLFPSATDTLGNVVLEAQASGVPVIVADAGGAREMIVNGTTGYIARAGDAVSFSERTIRLLRYASERRVMGQHARVHALGLTWPASLEPLVRTWENAVRQRGAASQDRSIALRHTA